MEADTARTEIKKDPLREFVLSAQGGDRDSMGVLWAAVENFVRWEANRRYTLTGTVGGADIDDLCQCGYLALVDAVGRYDPGKESASFLGLLSFRLKTAFSEAQGIRGHKDPLNLAISLDEKISDDLSDDAERTRANLIPDPRAEADFSEVEEKVFTEDLRKALFRALDTLPAARREIIKARYFEGRTLKAVAGYRGVSENAIREQERQALRQMRREAVKNGLDRFVDMHTVFYRRYSVEYMRRTQTSPVEGIFFDRERLRAQFYDTETQYTVL